MYAPSLREVARRLALEKLNIIKTPEGHAGGIGFGQQKSFCWCIQYTLVMLHVSTIQEVWKYPSLQAVMVDIDSRPMVDVWTPGV